jgi:hypothetical protein
MPTPSIETVRGWLGRVMIDRDGNRIGEITDLYLDNETGRPEWAVVRTGLFGLRSTFAPLAEATEVGRAGPDPPAAGSGQRCAQYRAGRAALGG